MGYLATSILIGTGATLATDAWALLRRKLFGVALPDYGLVGRWFGHMPRGRFVHAKISDSTPVPAERVIGWTVHYAIGVAFAGLLLAIVGLKWARDPTLGPALLVGMATVAAPYFVMQPGMGAGIAARRTPRPNRARLQSLLTHIVFGLGLYGTATILREIQ
jgi:hypothetical protein